MLNLIIYFVDGLLSTVDIFSVKLCLERQRESIIYRTTIQIFFTVKSRAKLGMALCINIKNKMCDALRRNRQAFYTRLVHFQQKSTAYFSPVV